MPSSRSPGPRPISPRPTSPEVPVPQQADAPVADLAGVRHLYRKTVALRDVSLRLQPGGLVGLIGPDGVGKSTLLGILAGAKRIQAGDVRLFGGDFRRSGHRRAVCSRIAYMPQGLGRNLYPDLTVVENLAFFSRLFGQNAAERRRRITALLAATGLAPFPDRPAGKLSGGMRQKLGLCCALIHDPDLLILDEPTTGVDPLSRRQFWDLVDEMRAGRPAMSVIVATAYMEEANRFAQLLAMNDGAVLASGTPADIMRQTGCASLDEAFIALLPQALRDRRVRPDIAPLEAKPGEVAIEAIHLTRRFGSFTAVDDVSFRIGRGEIFGFLGSNGCGKTTTMKMLTGLLPATSGRAMLFGRDVDATDKALRYRVGYMSQLFSLYTELTVEQNLALHARLYQIPPARAKLRIAELARDFWLTDQLDVAAGALPLGVRQRLALAVAVVNNPQVLILDEPTSGVDPLARDQFWSLLGRLSRKDGVTIFISTHFMNEAAQCDRIVLMNNGAVLVSGSPGDVVRTSGRLTLEAAFISLLEAANARQTPDPGLRSKAGAALSDRTAATRAILFSPRRLLAYARREALELSRDRIRLAFSLLGTSFLMLVLGFGMNTDVDHVPFAAYDQDRTPESRAYLDAYRGSIYFEERAPITDDADMAHRLGDAEIELAVEIPAGFGRDVRSTRRVSAAAWIGGAMPFYAQTTQGYVQGLQSQYLADLAVSTGQAPGATLAVAEPRFLFNQSFDSIRSLVPTAIALLLALVPAVLMALAVVREKEFGSITNLYVTPVTRLEFILGKQLPYVMLSMLSFGILVLIAIFVFGIPVKGSVIALLGGTTIYLFATTGYGLLISTFSSSQIAALFGTAILTFLPATQFAGMLSPVSSNTGMGMVIGRLFPMSYYLPVTIGTFTKSLGIGQLARTTGILALFVPGLIGLSLLLMRKQER
ncbi:ATP-binding cassette domain-containing protein [Lichenicoccus roseus]|uniref:ATP-binding cassette domain-containing protein n=1 Tax=Lichenicoccus roseus TaxID=2683649 RepID=A0A5R9JJK3_9PROT|nr:ATP-binding cassette domain-containing protein [Lichenicoccus roseus]